MSLLFEFQGVLYSLLVSADLRTFAISMVRTFDKKRVYKMSMGI